MNLEADRVVDFSLQLPEPYSGMSMRLKKVCPQCDATLHARKLACPCGHVFPAKAQQTKRKRPIESRQSAKQRALIGTLQTRAANDIHTNSYDL